MDEQHTTEGFDFERWLRVLRRRWWVVAACFLLVAGSAAAFSLTRHKVYPATASLLFHTSSLSTDILGIAGSSSSSDPARDTETNVKLVESPAVALRVSKGLHGRLGPQHIERKISVSPEGQSNVVAVRAKDRDPKFAAALATSYAQDFIAVRRDFNRGSIERMSTSVQQQFTALTPTERASPAGRSLQARVEQLNTLASLQTGDADLIEPASVPNSPSSPRTKLNILVGGFLGLLLGVGLALLMERLNRSVRESDELSDMYQLPVLGEVPHSHSLNGHAAPLSEREIEAFRMLQARVRYFNVDSEIRSLLVTSGTSQEGKSTVAWHLASAIAMSTSSKVLLLEADLRRPAVARQHGLNPGPGLADLLVDACSFTEAIQRVRVSGANEGPSMRRLVDVMVAGTVPHNPAELLESRRMAELLRGISARYDFVVLDSAPTLLVADPLPLMTQVDGVLVVSRLGRTTRHVATELRDQLRELNAPVLGVVANAVKSSTLTDYEAYVA
jgi:tyrosine-protein kinase